MQDSLRDLLLKDLTFGATVSTNLWKKLRGANDDYGIVQVDGNFLSAVHNLELAIVLERISEANNMVANVNKDPEEYNCAVMEFEALQEFVGTELMPLENDFVELGASRTGVLLFFEKKDALE
ncbi:hypothetical protein FGB62_206g05 [Gracilaria domingensis]|nr:hypothetical protein FGB62_416g00 [Gracilaria domingensis]KAI0558500.1 hypothetical protein FGB62_206g05 [Gracilaria domingensis]